MTLADRRPIPTALAALRAMADGSLTAEALVRACLDRIALREPAIHAWTQVAGDAALAAARRVDGGAGGPLGGLPIAVKDIIDSADLPTACGSALYAGQIPARDASCVALARAAGAIVLGKTVTTELAYFFPGPTVNPHDLGATPGGSSSGSAAAVADGMVPLAFATQTSGSIIRPAAFCGVVGYKPSFGLLDVTGIRPFAVSCDTLGVMAADLADAAYFVAVIADRPALRVDRAPPAAPPRVGLCRTPDWAAAEPAAQQRLLDVATHLRLAGARLSEVALPPVFAELGAAQATITAYEAARSLAAERLGHPEALSPVLRQFLAFGAAIAAETCDAARAVARRGRAALADCFADSDLLLTPATVGEAPAGLASTGDPLFNRVWTLLGAPCVALPAGVGPRRLPLAIQLVGRPDGDAALLAAAAWIEARLGDWRI